MHIEQKLTSLGLTLPRGTVPVANFFSTVQTGNLLFVSGHVRLPCEGSLDAM